MSDDAQLPAGAAAPKVERVIRSLVMLDALWVAASALLILIASRFQVVDLPNQSLSTGDSPYRIYALALPLVALVLAAVGAVRRSPTLLAVATSVIAPAAAGVGVLSASLFLDRNAAFADVGVAASLLAAVVCVAALIRWFVYHPVSLLHAESRPTLMTARSLAAAGVIAGGIITFHAIDDRGATTMQFAVQLLIALVVPIAVVAAAVVRTRLAFVVAGSAALAQAVAVLAVRQDGSTDSVTIRLESAVAIWTGPVALVALFAVAAVAAASIPFHRVDDEPDAAVDDERWRWSVDD